MKNYPSTLKIFIANKQIRLKYALIVIGILFSSISHGQTKTDDELHAIWKDKSRPEKLRLDAIWERLNVDTPLSTEPEWWKKWKVEVNEAIVLAIKNNKKEYLPLFYLRNMDACEGNTECMCTNAKKAIESAKIADASKWPSIFSPYETLKFQCKEDVKDEDIINVFNRYKSRFKQKPEENELLRLTNYDLGRWYLSNEKYPQALVYYLESQRFSEKLNSIDEILCITKLDIALIHIRIGNYKEAEKYIDKSIQISHSLKDTFQLGGSYLGKSNLMLKLKDQANALIYIDSAMYVMKNVKHCEPCYNQAKMYNAGIKNLSKNYSGALTELNEVEAFYNKEGGEHKPDPLFYTEKARAYLGLKKYNNAIQTINSVKVSEQTYNQDISDNYDILFKAYEGIGDYKNALKNYRLHVQAEDTLAKWRNSSEVTRIELENQFSQQQLKSELNFQTQLNKQKTTRNWILFLGISALLLALGLYARLRYTRKTQKLLQQKNEIIEAEKEKANTALNELKSTQTQLIQSEKMASLGELTAGIAHEIQNPLNFVNNFSELSVELAKELKEEAEKSELDKNLILELATDLSQNQEKINHHGKRASDIVKGMLEHSRKSTGEKEPTDINALCDEYLRLSYHGLRAKDKTFNANFETHFDPNLPKIDIIPQDMGRVILNLINNAFWAVNERNKNGEAGYEPTISITSKRVDSPLGSGLPASQQAGGQRGKGDNIQISISDNGSGIPDSIKDKIFQPFFTTKPTGQGTGLGLSLTYDIVTKGHGGTIEVESVPAKQAGLEREGTTFILKLPIQNNKV